MPATTDATPTRRAVFRATAATVPPDADAELIRLCSRWLELDVAEWNLFQEIKDDDAREATMEPMHDELKTIQDRLGEIGAPTTLEGAKAMAWVGLVNIDIGADGELQVGSDPEEWLFAGVADFVTGAIADDRESLLREAARWFGLTIWVKGDGELIRLCDRLAELRTHELAQFHKIDDDDHDPLETTDAEMESARCPGAPDRPAVHPGWRGGHGAVCGAPL